MPRILIALMVLLALTGSPYGETPPTPAAADHAALFTATHAENPVLRSLAATGAAQATPAALTCCKVCSIGKACGNT